MVMGGERIARVGVVMPVHRAMFVQRPVRVAVCHRGRSTRFGDEGDRNQLVDEAGGRSAPERERRARCENAKQIDQRGCPAGRQPP